jgi:putative sporulation protein YyaC
MVIESILEQMLNTISSDVDITYLCIGTDRATGDALGPIVGTMLTYHGLKVCGTIENPVHGLNLDQYEIRFKQNKPQHIVAIDACIGLYEDIGVVKFKTQGLRPGAGAGKNFPRMGDTSIIGIVESNNIAVHECRLYEILEMAQDIVDTILEFEKIRARNKRKISHIFKRMIGLQNSN